MPSEWSELEKDIPILLIEALSAFKKAGQRIETAHLDELTDYLKKVKYFEMLDSNRKKIFAKAVVASNEKILIYAFWNDFNQKFNPTEIVALSNRLCAYQDAELLRLTIGSCNASSPGALRLTLDVLHAASLLADPSLFQLLNEKILKKGRILAEKLSDQDKAKFFELACAYISQISRKATDQNLLISYTEAYESFYDSMGDLNKLLSKDQFLIARNVLIYCLAKAEKFEFMIRIWEIVKSIQI